MRKSKLTGILLKQSEYSDSSLVLKFFCINHGLISVLAKGIRRKTEREQLNNLCEYELELYEPREVGLWLLVEHCQLQDFSRLANPATWAAAECGLELASQMMVSPDEHSLIYLLTTSYLTYLQNVRNNAVPLIPAAYVWHLKASIWLMTKVRQDWFAEIALGISISTIICKCYPPTAVESWL